ncbi:unnamed protein product [Ilex paraguariensis]|uniref:Uncharacterized protein n=1 Tax=Ilex paraguariensis TaxID=185542 RepID=A0ABC8SVC8_9AQUA
MIPSLQVVLGWMTVVIEAEEEKVLSDDSTSSEEVSRVEDSFVGVGDFFGKHWKESDAKSTKEFSGNVSTAGKCLSLSCLPNKSSHGEVENSRNQKDRFSGVEGSRDYNFTRDTTEATTSEQRRRTSEQRRRPSDSFAMTNDQTTIDK